MKTSKFKTTTANSNEHELVYKVIEIPISGAKVTAHFPAENSDTKIMAMVQRILLASYINNTDMIEKKQ